MNESKVFFLGLILGLFYWLSMTLVFGVEVAEKVEFPDTAGTGVDPITDTGFWLKDVGGTMTLWKTDDTGDSRVGAGGVTAHGDLTGLVPGVGDHTDLLDGSAHSTAHDVAALNNGAAISGDVDGEVDQGGHNKNDRVHYVRPKQTVTVGKDGSGEYTTIAAALAVANAAATVSSPIEIAIYPGTYDENNLTVADYVSIRSVIPDQGIISSNTANAIINAGGINYFQGVFLNNQGAGECMKITGSLGGTIQIDNCSLSTSVGSGAAIDFNGKTHLVDIFNASSIFQGSGPAIINKTGSNSRLTMRNSSLSYGDSSAPNPAVIDINSGFATAPDEFTDCTFTATGLTGGTSPSAFLDCGASEVLVKGCRFQLKAAAGNTFTAIFAQSGTVTVVGSQIEWTSTAGTAYDFNAAGGAAINHASTVYDLGKVTGAGTVTFLREGSAGFEALDVLGPTLMTGGALDDPVLQVNQTSSGDAVTIEPTITMATGETWRGLRIIGNGVTPFEADQPLFGIQIDMSTVPEGVDPALCGLNILMGAGTTAGDFHAAKFQSTDGRELVLLNKDFIVKLEAETGIALKATDVSSATNTVEDVAVFEAQTVANMAAGFGGALLGQIVDDALVENTIFKLAFERANGADNDGTFSLSAAQSGTLIPLIVGGDGTGLLHFPQAEDAAAGAGPVRFGSVATGMDVTDDGLGAILDCSGGDPLWIGETVIVEIGDAAGVESFRIVDSAFSDVFRLPSDGAGTMPGTLTVGDGVAEKILGVTDGTNTAMLGYDGVPHVVITGDSTFIVYSDDTDSDTNLISRGDGVGTGRVRAQTSGGDYIDITHDGVRGTIASSLGGILMDDDTEFAGTIEYTSTGGNHVGGIGVIDNTTATVISVAGTPVQFLGFDTNNPSHGVTPDHTLDELTANADGIYMCWISTTLESVSAGAQKFGIQVFKNDVTPLDIHAHRQFQGGAGDLGSLGDAGTIELNEGDTVQLKLVNESSAGDILVEDSNLTIRLEAGI